MHHRNVLPLVRRIAGMVLGAVLLAQTLPALAEKPAEEARDSFPLISLLMPSLLSPTPAEPNAGEAEGALNTFELRAAPLPSGSIDLTANSDNLWDRLRNGFSMPDLNDDLTLYYQQWYQNRPDALRRMVERSRPYMHFIVQELEARGMPTELALLPMVESSFNPMANSRSNASGLWQFIPATGKRFNLEQNWWQDKRRDIVASTGAALDYLQTIYEMHGDWQLALASYNWGEGAVKRAIEKNNSRGLPTDYVNLTMPNETRHYVPKLQALKNIFGNPALMVQLHLPEILNRPYFATIDTPHPIDVKTAARLANMPLDEFIALNPSHNRPVIKADTPLVLPADKLTLFRSNLEKNAAPLSEWQAYTLKHGERLRQIAPRFGISLPELARINSLPSGIRLGAGTTLLVPAGQGGDDLNSVARGVAPTQIVEAEPEVVCRKHCRPASARGDKAAKSHAERGETRLSAREANAHGKRAERASGKGSHKVAAAEPGKNPAKSARATSSESKHKTASSKAGSPAKVAKSTTGRRG
ncbi:MAG: Peptidoglycan-binding LysM:Lytic transglycosylase, catalytic [Proteobacteria bacterium]|nr:Peptidoglycan-binding LysM:Lytic transglycosylase, catalytic [Pseudomonadota bacterium]